MKKILMLAAVMALLAAPSYAAEEAASVAPSNPSPQAEKMKNCNKEYSKRAIPKAERRKFMSACLKKNYVTGSYQPQADTAGKAAAGSTEQPATVMAPSTPPVTPEGTEQAKVKKTQSHEAHPAQ